MKKFLLFLLVATPVFAINDFTVPYSSFSDSGIIYASEHNANWDSIQTHHNALIDTIDGKFIRFTDLTSGDTTLTLLKVNTLKMLDTVNGNPKIDSAKGNPTYHTGRFVTDTVTVNKNLTADSVKVTKGINVLYIDIQRADVDTINSLNKMTGNPVTDSLSGVVKISGSSAKTTMDTVYASKFSGALTGNITGTADSAKGAHHLSGGAVSATTGAFSSTVTADSIKVTKGIQSLYMDIQRADIDTINNVLYTNSYKSNTGKLYTSRPLNTAGLLTAWVDDSSLAQLAYANDTIFIKSTDDNDHTPLVTVSYKVLAGSTINNLITQIISCLQTIDPASTASLTDTGSILYATAGVTTGMDSISITSNRTATSSIIHKILYHAALPAGEYHTTPGNIYGQFKVYDPTGDIVFDSIYATKINTSGAITAGGNIITGANDIITDSIFARTIKTTADIFTTAFTSWAPTVTLEAGTGDTVPVYLTNNGYYHRIGNFTFGTITLTNDGGAEGKGTGILDIQMPTNINSNFQNIGTGEVRNGSTYSNVLAQRAGTNVICLLITGATGSYLTGVGQNNTSRYILLHFAYEASP